MAAKKQGDGGGENTSFSCTNSHVGLIPPRNSQIPLEAPVGVQSRMITPSL